MNIHDATEQAYKNGLQAAERTGYWNMETVQNDEDASFSVIFRCGGKDANGKSCNYATKVATKYCPLCGSLNIK